jgi:hypothetical protein
MVYVKVRSRATISPTRISLRALYLLDVPQSRYWFGCAVLRVQALTARSVPVTYLLSHAACLNRPGVYRSVVVVSSDKIVSDKHCNAQDLWRRLDLVSEDGHNILTLMPCRFCLGPR